MPIVEITNCVDRLSIVGCTEPNTISDGRLLSTNSLSELGAAIVA